jgi:hypothetical protein
MLENVRRFMFSGAFSIKVIIPETIE